MNSLLLTRMEQWRQGMGVRRFHTIPGLGEQQTVGHHSCGVALVVLMCHPEPSAELLRLCLIHDLNEGKLGDLPATTKWRSADLHATWNELERDVNTELGLIIPNVTPFDVVCFELADNLEGLLYCREQMRLGNMNYHTVACNWSEHLFDKDCWDLAPAGFRLLFAELWNDLHPDRPMEVGNVPGLS